MGEALGIAMVVYIYGNGRRVKRAWIAADVNEQGKALFVTWTTQPPTKGLAKYGQAADAATTGAGLAAGLAEVNPLLGSTPILAAVALAKIAAVPALRRHSIGACYQNIAPLVTVGWAAAAWNLAAIAGMGPAGIIPAIGVAMAMHPDVPERFWSCVPEMDPNVSPEVLASMDKG